MDLKLYCTPATISLAAVLTAFELELEPALMRVDFANQGQRAPDYLALNPKGRVPALVTGGEVLTETGAILAYLATLRPEAGLMPEDPMQAARMREMMFYLASTMHVNHAHKMRGHRWADEASSHRDMTAKVTETMTESAAYVESMIKGPWVLGEAISLADFYLAAVATWLPGDGVELADYPKLQGLLRGILERPCGRKARELGLVIGEF